jgi:hypothetical protein
LTSINEYPQYIFLRRPAESAPMTPGIWITIQILKCNTFYVCLDFCLGSYVVLQSEEVSQEHGNRNLADRWKIHRSLGKNSSQVSWITQKAKHALFLTSFSKFFSAATFTQMQPSFSQAVGTLYVDFGTAEITTSESARHSWSDKEHG